MPSPNPPISTPATLPNPPRITTTKDLSRGRSPIVGNTEYRGSDHEHRGVDGADVDAHHFSRFPVLTGGPDRLAHLCFHDEEIDGDKQRQCHRKDHDPLVADGEAEQ
ncbi:hypothetical protein ES708_33218 [subsurface metagenome]